MIATLPETGQVRLRDYQTAASTWLSRHRRALLVAPAGSGKTVMAAAALRMRIESKVRVRPVKILWLANTREQVSQGEAALAAMLPPGHEIVVACVAGFTAERLAEFSPDVVVLDEAHHFKTAETWQSLLAGYDGPLWATTATPWGEDQEGNARLRNLVEGNIWTVDRAAVAANLAKLEVKWVRFEPRPNIKDEIDSAIREGLARRTRFQADHDGKIYAQVAWGAVLKHGIVEHAERTDALIGAMLKHRGEPILALVPNIEMGRAIAERTGGVFVSSKTLGRAKIMAAYRAGEITTLVATSLADEGLDLPSASVLGQFSGGRSNARTEQRAGRVMRKSQGKSAGIVYDAVDDWHPLAMRHARQRAQVYQRLTGENYGQA